MYFNVTYDDSIVGDRVKEYLAIVTPHIRSDIVDNIMTVLNEALSNAINANRAKQKRGITVTWHENGKSLRLEIFDFGGGFSHHVRPTMPRPEDQSGRGIPIMMLCCDRLVYSSTAVGTLLQAYWINPHG